MDNGVIDKMEVVRKKAISLGEFLECTDSSQIKGKKQKQSVVGTYCATMCNKNIFGVFWHRVYKSLELYWRDGTPLFQKMFLKLVFR